MGTKEDHILQAVDLVLENPAGNSLDAINLAHRILVYLTEQREPATDLSMPRHADGTPCHGLCKLESVPTPPTDWAHIDF